MSIEAHADLRAYFHERVRAAMDRLSVQARPDTELYLVDLLAEGRRQALATPDQPLVHRLQEALAAADARERLQILRGMGDAALYTCGFFADHVERRGMSPDYYVAMGGRAYREASSLCNQRRATFGELAGGFRGWVRVIGEVREHTMLRTPQDIVKLYDRWRKSRSPEVAARLHAAGVFPQVPGGSLH
ncbi:MAG TPA: hypothetical protein RMH85_28355 [Polyangiaceae bacterium LLY-WYZ-15_(1-7)]|nr:hypothetical protein [Polyangiaceae bacterium LLY-WYZ-15_(1-7)]HJL00043.1 hypothetical protein [Polyangiaceae bacterium LLY-WYZ-15_(1-7)]HJL12426.1 hypothetical protein [Polyangiaceae bacterium LLY-WYZ-15_(1-7)]HJL27047.1 hypothetical protein [Polyangiaceae bacterium LLY-WYZ-15_(1-7)]HJL33997.1 hypothetical protein [Polyangiaceae bacterium LLY-WYZ-15_(1-7)]